MIKLILFLIERGDYLWEMRESRLFLYELGTRLGQQVWIILNKAGSNSLQNYANRNAANSGHSALDFS